MGLLDMLTENLVVRLRLVVYAILVFFSFFIFVGVAVLKDKYQGLCVLYDNTSVSNCNYPMAIAIIFQLIYTLYRIVILLLLVLGKFTTGMFLFSDIMELVYAVLDVMAFIMTFIAACILSAGHNNSLYIKYCESCKSASNVAQAGAWISTFLWLFIAGVGFLYILRAGKLPCMRSAGTAGNTGTTTSSAPPVDTPPNFDDPPKY